MLVPYRLAYELIVLLKKLLYHLRRLLLVILQLVGRREQPEGPHQLPLLLCPLDVGPNIPNQGRSLNRINACLFIGQLAGHSVAVF